MVFHSLTAFQAAVICQSCSVCCFYSSFTSQFLRASFVLDAEQSRVSKYKLCPQGTPPLRQAAGRLAVLVCGGLREIHRTWEFPFQNWDSPRQTGRSWLLLFPFQSYDSSLLSVGFAAHFIYMFFFHFSNSPAKQESPFCIGLRELREHVRSCCCEVTEPGFPPRSVSDFSGVCCATTYFLRKKGHWNGRTVCPQLTYSSEMTRKS